jgi:ubiquinone/menaquinone biosynthesis C-methylase UbiE
MPYDIELKEHPSTYIVQDRGDLDELARLEIQDKMLTTAMGGVLPEVADPSRVLRVLDVGCGTGGWLMEMACTYPTIEKLFGVDISGKVTAYAGVRAGSLELGSRVEFQTMDALRMLEYPKESLDLVNQRLGISWLRRWEWLKLLHEYQRVTRTGGTIRITEPSHMESNSPALMKLLTIGLEAFRRSGRFFTESSDDITSEIARLMTQYGIEDVKSRIHTLVFQGVTPAGQDFYQDVALGFRVAVPFFRKWIHLPNDYEEVYQQALKEVQQPDFVATWTLVTLWGTRPENGGRLRMRGLR